MMNENKNAIAGMPGFMFVELPEPAKDTNVPCKNEEEVKEEEKAEE